MDACLAGGIDFPGDGEFLLDRRLLLIYRRSAHQLARGALRALVVDLPLPLDVDENRPAMLFQCIDVVFGGDEKALIHERRTQPRAIELGYIHAKFEFLDRDLLFVHALPRSLNNLKFPLRGLF